MNRHVHCIFSDDVRHEIGGKISLIGVYGAQMMVPEFPCVIPKLCLTLKAITPSTDPFKSIKVAVLQDDVVIAETVASAEEISAVPCPPQNEVGSDAILMQTLSFSFIFTPLFLESACVIKTRVYDEGREELRGQGLYVIQAPGGAILQPG